VRNHIGCAIPVWVCLKKIAYETGKGLGINKISHHPEMLPGNEFPGIGAVIQVS